MCVAVTLNPGATLTEEEVFKMGMANGDGFGFAWAEDGIVNWWKTLQYDVDYLTHLINSYKEFPRFVHFRLSTVGGVKVELCHPFEVGPMATAAVQGHAQKVLMHNGHWSMGDDIFKILRKEGGLPDDGPWTDTRLAALLASRDELWLTVVTGKVATLDGDGTIKTHGFWDDLRTGIKVSNKYWNHDHQFPRHGSNRHWQGWGWNEVHWKNHDAWKKQKEKDEAEERKKREEEEDKKDKANGKNGKTGSGKKQGTAGKEDEKGAGDRKTGAGGGQEGDVASGPRNRHVLPAGSTERDPGDEQKEARMAQVVRRYDYTPWYNRATGEWVQVDPNGTGTVRLITEDEAVAYLEQAAIARRPAGDDETGA